MMHRTLEAIRVRKLQHIKFKDVKFQHSLERYFLMQAGQAV